MFHEWNIKATKNIPGIILECYAKEIDNILAVFSNKSHV